MTRCDTLHGHVIDRLRALPAGSVHCVVTSPPYWGLRSYGTEPQIWGGKSDCAHEWGSAGQRHRGGPQGTTGQRSNRDTSAQDLAQSFACGDTCRHCGAWRGELGLEPTPELYRDHMVEVFREIWRVLRDDGTLWLNLGDTYAAGGRGGNPTEETSGLQGGQDSQRTAMVKRSMPVAPGLKPKDLVGIPWMIAFALRAAGWYLRSDIVWNKPNPMPESCRDRPTKSHEYIFLLTKSERYFYDRFAARETVSGTANPRGNGVNPKARASLKMPNGWDTGAGTHGSFHRNGREKGKTVSLPRAKQNESFSAVVTGLVSDRNWRDVWTVTTEPFPDAHYATFPTEIARRCILAGTSEGGCCATCGAPRERVIELGEPDRAHQQACGGDAAGEYTGTATKNYADAGAQDPSAVKARILAGMREKKTVGWKPTCDCAGASVAPCVVLDPFGGSGTVGEVAQALGRHAILIELLPANIALIERRTNQPGLILTGS